MEMIIHVCGVILVEFGIGYAESDDLPAIVDGKGSSQDCAGGKIGDKVIQIDNGIARSPQKGPGAQRAAGLANHLAEIIDAERLAVAAALKRADRLHARIFSPHEGSHTLKPF